MNPLGGVSSHSFSQLLDTNSGMLSGSSFCKKYSCFTISAKVGLSVGSSFQHWYIKLYLHNNVVNAKTLSSYEYVKVV